MQDEPPGEPVPPSSGQTLSILDKLRHKARADNRNYLTRGHVPQGASVSVINCPCCGAARAGHSDIRFCVYCNHAFLGGTAEG